MSKYTTQFLHPVLVLEAATSESLYYDPLGTVRGFYRLDPSRVPKMNPYGDPKLVRLIGPVSIMDCKEASSEEVALELQRYDDHVHQLNKRVDQVQKELQQVKDRAVAITLDWTEV